MDEAKDMERKLGDDKEQEEKENDPSVNEEQLYSNMDMNESQLSAPEVNMLPIDSPIYFCLEDTNTTPL